MARGSSLVPGIIRPLADIDKLIINNVVIIDRLEAG